MAGLEGVEGEPADGDADEPEGGVADGGGHAADLAVFSFDEGERDPAVRDFLADADRGDAGRDHRLGSEQMDPGRGAAVALDGQSAAAEEIERAFPGDAFDLGVVGLGLFRAGVEDAGDEIFFITEEEEAFGIAVESADRPDFRRQGEIGEGALAGDVRGELAEDIEGLVEGDKHGKEDGSGAPVRQAWRSGMSHPRDCHGGAAR